MDTLLKNDLQITGTGHGIGRELALLYASEGATVVGWDVNEENNNNTIAEIAKRGYPKAYGYRYVQYCTLITQVIKLILYGRIKSKVPCLTSV